MAGEPVGGDALLVTAGAALLVFILSGGVYAGTDGRARSVAMVVGILGVAVSAALVITYARRARNRTGG